MISKANEEYLEQTFQDNLKRIPPFLRLSKVSIGIGIGLVVVTVIALSIILNINYSMYTGRSMALLAGAINGTVIFCIGCFIIGIVLVWFACCYALEKSAYRKASMAAAKLSELEEEHNRRNYEPLLKTYYREPKEETKRPDFCPECGEVLFEEDSVCPKCGAKIQ